MEKLFVDFAILSQAVKMSTLKYLSKHAFSLRNALSLQKFYHKARKSDSTTILLLMKYMVSYDIAKYVSTTCWIGHIHQWLPIIADCIIRSFTIIITLGSLNSKLY